MACSEERLKTIHHIIDGEATEQEIHELKTHILSCASCREVYESLVELDQELNQFALPEVSIHFTDKVMNQLPKPVQRQRSFVNWLKRHPVVVSAACFLLLMLGYVFSLGQDQAFQAKVVKGNGQLAYSGHHTVVVPKDQVIKGDLVIKNGDVKIEGKVDGNVILVNSHSLMASAGEVTGHVERVNRAVGWVWYQIKAFFQTVF
ncbi:hypothetical protein PU629_21420 [Pullulanibacillus sp. KACC 23026]|uniref:hypothetical protein n=1 Tax=Pullulanibacillus sp. KACC 23026 TaxID=3028315 RepID=UPI0023AF1FE9|nr:hypothetical protein [Pullulanibacillus sp. KACC 23026]WEG12615.1 hypothetical protein PU629_21420 [Pullulanibacillus sp. KACC 23026]